MDKRVLGLLLLLGALAAAAAGAAIGTGLARWADAREQAEWSRLAVEVEARNAARVEGVR